MCNDRCESHVGVETVVLGFIHEHGPKSLLGVTALYPEKLASRNWIQITSFVPLIDKTK